MLPTILGSICQLKTYFGIGYIMPTLHYAFSEKRGSKMFNYELLFLHGFSWRNREILNKAVLTPQK